MAKSLDRASNNSANSNLSDQDWKSRIEDYRYFVRGYLSARQGQYSLGQEKDTASEINRATRFEGVVSPEDLERDEYKEVFEEEFERRFIRPN
jgi:hypothetical protein